METDFKAALAQFGFQSYEDYEACLTDIQDKLNGLNDLDWIEIVKKYNLPISSDSLRKANAGVFGGKFVAEYIRAQREEAPSYVEQMHMIRKEKQKLSDERAALRKVSRDQARAEQNLEYLEKLIRAKEWPLDEVGVRPAASDNDLLVCLHDLHYGLDVSNSFGAYNSHIAAKRMAQYLESILEIQKRHGSQNAYVMLGGDLISGRIHHTVQLQNRENIVEQVQGTSELIACFVWRLAQHFDHVYVNGTCGGNHSRLDTNKDQVLRGERLDLLVPWYIKARLSNVENVVILEDATDPTIATMQIRGKTYVGVHGDLDSYSERGVQKLQALIEEPIEAVIMGHLHHCSFDDVANVKLVRSGSFCDPIDDYSISKRLVGHAAQMVLVVDERGVQTFYPVDLR